MLGDAGVVAGHVREQARGCSVIARPHRRRQRFVDAGADDRMGEDEGPPGIEDPCADENLGCSLRLGVGKPGEARRLVRLAVFEDGKCLRQPDSGLR